MKTLEEAKLVANRTGWSLIEDPKRDEDTGKVHTELTKQNCRIIVWEDPETIPLSLEPIENEDWAIEYINNNSGEDHGWLFRHEHRAAKKVQELADKVDEKDSNNTMRSIESKMWDGYEELSSGDALFKDLCTVAEKFSTTEERKQNIIDTIGDYVRYRSDFEIYNFESGNGKDELANDYKEVFATIEGLKVAHTELEEEHFDRAVAVWVHSWQETIGATGCTW